MTETDALTQRMQENYKIREGERKFMMYFNPDSQLPLWTAGKGDHGVDIIPYFAGANDPAVVQGKIKEGDPQYVLDIYIHQNIGPGDEQFICLQANYRQPCPVCEYRNTVIREAPPEDADQRTKDQHDSSLDALRFKRRVAYNIVNITNATEEAKGVQVWEIAHWFMERELLILAGRGKDRGKGFISYAHQKLGKTIWFARTGTGATSTKYGGYAFEDRDYDIPQGWLDGVFVIDQHIIIPEYDHVRTVLHDGIDKAKESGDGGDTGVRAARRSRAGTSESPDEESASVEESASAEEPRRHRPAAEPDVAASTARKPRTAAAETDVENPRSPRRTRDEAPAEEPVTEPAPAPKRLGKAGGDQAPVEESAPAEPAPAVTKDRCPVPDGRYGIDTDKFEACDTCSIWESCVKSAERRKRDGR